MLTRYVMLIAAVAFGQVGCTAANAESAAPLATAPADGPQAKLLERAPATHGEVTVERTVYTFGDAGEDAGLTRRSYVITGAKVGAPVEELLEAAPAEPIRRPPSAGLEYVADGRRYDVVRPRYETARHRNVIDRTKVVNDGGKVRAATQPAAESEGPGKPASGPVGNAGWLDVLRRVGLALFGSRG